MDGKCCICEKVFSIEENTEFWSLEDEERGEPKLLMCPQCSVQDGATEYMLDKLKEATLKWEGDNQKKL